MEIKSLPVSGYRDIEIPDKKLSNVSLQEQTQNTLPNITINGNGALPVTSNTDSNQDNEQKDKRDNQLKSAIDVANNKLRFTKTKCEFKYYEDVNRVAIKVIDRETEEVIREIPPEETIELVQRLWELAGIIVDEKR